MLVTVTRTWIKNQILLVECKKNIEHAPIAEKEENSHRTVFRVLDSLEIFLYLPDVQSVQKIDLRLQSKLF